MDICHTDSHSYQQGEDSQTSGQQQMPKHPHSDVSFSELLLHLSPCLPGLRVQCEVKTLVVGVWNYFAIPVAVLAEAQSG